MRPYIEASVNIIVKKRDDRVNVLVLVSFVLENSHMPLSVRGDILL